MVTTCNNIRPSIPPFTRQGKACALLVSSVVIGGGLFVLFTSAAAAPHRAPLGLSRLSPTSLKALAVTSFVGGAIGSTVGYFGLENAPKFSSDSFANVSQKAKEALVAATDARKPLNKKNEEGRTPLMDAVIQCSPIIVRRLSEQGASRDLVDNEGHTAAWHAISSNQSDLLIYVIGKKDGPLLLQQKCYYYLKSWLKKYSPPQGLVLEAAKSGDAEALQLLIDARVNVDEVDEEGRTPLIHAAIKGHASCGKLLLANKANQDHEDSQGNTAYFYAKHYCPFRPDLHSLFKPKS